MGIVWTTEVAHTKSEGRPIDGVAIPAPYNKQEKVAYAIGRLSQGKNQGNAEAFLHYLSTDAVQSIYGKYGFLRATADELALKDISLN
ncbi:MAG: substrate-binding domain-containing protein [Pseudomonadota bacterium]